MCKLGVKTGGAFGRYKWSARCRAGQAVDGVGLQAETAKGGLDRFGAGCYRAGQLPGECQLPRFDLMKRGRAGNDRTDLASATGRSLVLARTNQFIVFQ